MSFPLWFVAFGALVLALIVWKVLGPVPVVGNLLALAVGAGLLGHAADWAKR